MANSERTASAVVQPFPRALKRPTAAEAQMAQAEALNRVAAALEGFSDAASTVHGFGERLDRLCAWLTGKWPWIIGLAVSVLMRTINLSPDEIAKTVQAVSEVAKVAAHQ